MRICAVSNRYILRTYINDWRHAHYLRNPARVYCLHALARAPWVHLPHAPLCFHVPVRAPFAWHMTHALFPWTSTRAPCLHGPALAQCLQVGPARARLCMAQHAPLVCRAHHAIHQNVYRVFSSVIGKTFHHPIVKPNTVSLIDGK